MSNMPDLSSILSMLSNNKINNDEKNFSPEDALANLMNSSYDSTTNSDDSNNSMPDMETIMKIMKVMRNANESTPSKELLRSLKPFLNESRKDKIDVYIKLLGMSKVIEIFNESGDSKK